MIRNSGRGLQVIASGAIGGAFLALAVLASWPAQAQVCGVTGGSIFPNSGTCAEVRAQVGDHFGGQAGTPIPPNYGYSPVGGTANVIAGGPGGGATATAIAEAGLLRLTATAEQGSADPTAYAFAHSTAVFAEGGTIDLAGGTLGDLVHGIVTVDIQGTTIGQAFLNESHLNFSSRQAGILGNNFGVDFPTGVYQFDVHIGDEAVLSLGLSIYASAADTLGFPFSSADFGNSAHLYFDFLEPGVYFNSTSGHDYSSAAAAPEPAAVWLLGTSLAGLGGRRWLRRRISS